MDQKVLELTPLWFWEYPYCCDGDIMGEAGFCLNPPEGDE
jgi:hypothetical protein